MYASCPKCKAASGGAAACPSCGLIFAKYLKTVVGGTPVRAAKPEERQEGRWKSLFLHVPEEINPGLLYARAALLAIAAAYGVHLALMDIPSWEMGGSLMHLVLLPFHEFGHLLFRPFGEFMTLLGGSLFQVMLPLILGGVFLLKNRDPFAASLMAWWAAAGVMDAAPYVYDAWKPQHILLTGRTGDTGAHDFIDVLGDLGLLHKAQPIGRGVHAFSIALMLVALAWSSWVLRLQWRVKRG